MPTGRGPAVTLALFCIHGRTFGEANDMAAFDKVKSGYPGMDDILDYIRMYVTCHRDGPYVSFLLQAFWMTPRLMPVNRSSCLTVRPRALSHCRAASRSFLSNCCSWVLLASL